MTPQRVHDVVAVVRGNHAVHYHDQLPYVHVGSDSDVTADVGDGLTLDEVLEIARSVTNTNSAKSSEHGDLGYAVCVFVYLARVA